MALAYSNISVELKEIFLKNRPQELYDISSKGTVPVLYINKSTIIDESLDIMLWAIDQHNPNNWIVNKKEQLEIIKINDTEFKHWLDRYKYHDRYPKNNREFYQDKCHEFLSKLESLLMQKSFLLSKNLQFVDIAIFPFIRQLANVNNDWFNNKYTKLANWLNEIVTSQLFKSVMNKYTEYHPKQSPLIINFNQK